jgi:sterol desaturase/sphingolipid hydroxylase (fatty acid hydroxylase superfamily)
MDGTLKNLAVNYATTQLLYTVICFLIESTHPESKNRRELFWTQFRHSFGGVLAGVICQEAWIELIDPISHWHGYYENGKHEYGWMMAVVNVAFFILTYDTVFYWVHRLLHVKKPINFYRMFHKEHHYVETTTCAGAAVNPMEVFILSIGLHLPKFLMPYPVWMHHALLGMVFLQSIVAHDSRLDIFNHQEHHKTQNYHYAFTLPLWDWVMGTGKPQVVRK